MNVKSLRGMLLVSGYATLASLSTMVVLRPELFTRFTTPKPGNTLPQSIVRPSVLV
jgi:hypothetical protein